MPHGTLHFVQGDTASASARTPVYLSRVTRIRRSRLCSATARGPLSPRGGDRPGRRGHGLSGRGRQARPQGGDQGAPAGHAGRGYEPQRFLREIRIAARLAHPQILPLHDSGEIEPRAACSYFVMPYAGCESLRDRLAREGPLPVDVALRITRAVAARWAYAHRLDVIHRDIKPENILLQEGEPVVADFGVATAISAAGGDSVYITDHGFAVGTPAYMSPEQASAEAGPRRADRPVQPRLRALRDAGRRAAVRRHRRARHDGPACDRAPRRRSGTLPAHRARGRRARARARAGQGRRRTGSRGMTEFVAALVAPTLESCRPRRRAPRATRAPSPCCRSSTPAPIPRTSTSATASPTS